MTLNIREMRQYSRESIRSIRENWQPLLLTALFVCGLFCGCFMLKSNVYRAADAAESAVGMLTDTHWPVRFKLMVLEVMIGLILAFSCGFSAIGLPLILSLPCAKGMVYGVVAAQLYTVYRIKGVVFSLLVLFPFLAAEVAFLILCLRDSLHMSALLFSAFKSGGGAGERGEVKAYCVRFLVFSVVCVLIILLQSLLGGAVGSALLS